MQTPRIFHPSPIGALSYLELATAPSRHLARVLRLAVGDELAVFDGNGGEYQARIESSAAGKVTLVLSSHRAIERESALGLHLIQAIAKGDNADWMVQKAVELGVRSITPITTERTVVRLTGERARKRHQHWQAVIAGACEQCGRNRVPALRPVRDFREALAQCDRGRTRLIMEPRAEKTLMDLPPPGVEVDLLTGPEGGFSEDELAAAALAGFTPVRLGPRVLRAETAVVSALTALQVRWGDLAG